MTPAIALCLTIQLLNDANIPTDVLAEVRDELRAIYARAGIEVQWHNEPSDATPSRRLAVKIVPQSFGAATAKPHVMGIAPGEQPGGTLVYVFYDRVEQFARAKRVLSSTMLAHVIAHELGHLLLPKGWHSRRGLMRGTWDLAQVSAAARGQLTFTREEIRTISADLSSR
jgi:hypothetical protein